MSPSTTILAQASVAAPEEPGAGAPTERALSIGIASAVRLVREGLALSLSGRPRIERVQMVNFDAAGLTLLAQNRPHVALVDLCGMHPATAAPAVKAICPGVRLVAFALAEVDQAIFECAAAGFDGYVPRESGAEDVYQVVLDVADGRMNCAPHITAAMFRRLADLLRPGTNRLSVLTMREREILEFAEQGCSNKEIARRLSLSNATVKNHMHSVLQKLQVSRRGQAAARLRGGPFDPDRTQRDGATP